MADITKILIRRGTDYDRRNADGFGIQLNAGEPGWTIDTKRLFVGDGITLGGISIGQKNLGVVTNIFGTYANGFTEDAALKLSGAQIGDVLYESSTGILYSLSSLAYQYDPLPLASDLAVIATNAFVSFGSLTTLLTSISGLSSIPGPQGPPGPPGPPGSGTSVGSGVLSASNLHPSIVDGITITIDTSLSAIRVKNGGTSDGIGVNHMRHIAPYSLYMNTTGLTAAPQIVTVGQNQVIGRITGALSAFDVSTMLAANTAAIINAMYPVGEIIISRQWNPSTKLPVNPVTWLGQGTWVLLSDAAGSFLVGYTSADTRFWSITSTGGSYTTTLTEANLPPHAHGFDTINMGGRASTNGSNGDNFNLDDTDLDRSLGTYSLNLFESGNGAMTATPFTNMPPYMTVFVWQRTA